MSPLLNACKKSFLLALTLVCISCASPKKRAIESMKAGNYDQAARYYEMALKRDPSDPEAIVGLREARTQLISKDLIEVRKARSSGNSEQALSLLMNVLRKQKDWQFNAGGSAVYTQEEEMGFAVKTVNQKVETALNRKNALSGLSLLKQYAPIYQGKRAETSARFEGRLQQLGTSRCREMQRNDLQKNPYFAEFVIKYCHLWKVDTASLEGNIGDKQAILFRQVKVDSKIKNLPQELYPIFEEQFMSGLKKTAWYSAAGSRDLRFDLSGDFESTQGQNPVQLVHSYSITEPYVTTEKVRKTRTVPYITQVNQYDPLTKKYKNVPQTQYRQETYYVTENVTKERQVPRTYPYGAWKHFQSLKITLYGASEIDGRKVSVSVSEKNHSESVQHDINMPDIGLKPSPLTLPDEISWLKDQTSKLEQQVSKKLGSLWSDMYCAGSDTGASMASSGERVHRCLAETHRDKKVPSSVDSWYQKHFGLSYAQANQAVGLY